MMSRPPEFAKVLFDELLRDGGVGQVAGETTAPPINARVSSRGSGSRSLTHTVAPAGGELDGDGASDAAAGAGHEGNFILQ